MQETLGELVYAPWIYVLIALSVLLDVFLPFLPSGVIVIAAAATAAGATTAGTPAGAAAIAAPAPNAPLPTVCALVLCAAAASVLGDLTVYRLARHGSDRFTRTVDRSRRLARARERLGHALARGGGPLVVLARFVPGGRSVMSLAAGMEQRRAREFLPWSALAGLAWAGYGVGAGYVGGQWFGATWLGTAVSVLALFGAGVLAAFLVRRGPLPAARAS
ncbi:DedA family protein [Streptomyces sp. CNQ085]|uniref:DedA family protein n=1 Tax=Streptomyces sp. CNQ085 TaxID=2886944 RepID=UPI001F50B824|nr:VTT domain-containing protein [Streptomyces sp. CNQ085]MCI0385118.1 VTT domain-containing protein [Streptomyces sp. CNQ085]